MLRSLFFAILFVPFVLVSSSFANEAQFFENVQGKWTGPGELVAGKYKGTKFICVFDGIKPDQKIGMKIDGYCRVGVVAQPMNANIFKKGGRFTGTFLDGEAGEGMNITGGKYSKNRFVANIKRKDLRGALVARQTAKNKMNITVSVRVNGKLVPVIGMSLTKVNSFPKLANNQNK